MEEIVINTQYFNLKYTLECGQCFRWKKIYEDDKSISYIGVIKDRVLKVTQVGNVIHVKSNNFENLKDVVVNYFDLDTDYGKIESDISKIDENVKLAVKNNSGIRNLRQDFFEMIISYIISANNNIPRISKSIDEISKRYGTEINFEGEAYYLFPTVNQLSNVTKDEFRKCGVGFRDKYLFDTVSDIKNGKFDICNFKEISTEKLRKKLMELSGVGPKVADCILLFACERKESFPIDVWVERVMSLLYFKDLNGNVSKKTILKYANDNFGSYAGIVQQHLFYNIREGIIKV